MTAADVEPASVPRFKVSSDRDALLATKLHLPWPLPGSVPRLRLAARLDEGLGRGLLLVCAPAGYGKTVLLADWVRGVRTGCG
jgi:LuxR family maltose regulon positive regulatory protein